MSTKIETLELEIVSNSQGATAGLDALTSSLTKLKNATKGGMGLTAISREIAGFRNNMGKTIKLNASGAGSFTDLFHKIKSGVNVISKVGKSLWSAVEESSDYQENVHLFSVAMGEYAGSAMTYAEQVRDAMGIDTSDWIRNQGVFMTLATGFGVAGDRASQMSQQLTQLGYDLASFYNLDVEDAMVKLQSGLAGELEPLRRIGYDLSNAKLEATALELGIDKAVSSMTQAEKAELRYYAIMTQVTETHGDMAATLDAPANQLRILKSEVNMAAREIGNLFIPALNAILPIAIAVTRAIGALATGISGLMGNKKIGLTETTSKVVENTDALSSNLEDAQGEAKKLKSYMMGIDELNVLNPDSGSSEASSSGQFDFELPTYDFFEGLAESKVAAITDELMEWLGISEELTSWWDLLATNLGNILVSVGLIGVGIVAWKIGDVVTDAIKMAALMDKLARAAQLMGIALKAMGVAAVIAAATAGAVWLFKNTDSTLTKIGAIVSAAALGVGAILAFTGINLPLGIALMAVGAVAMGSAIALNTTALSDEVKGIIATITAVVSVALLAVGAILAFTGVNIPLGIALMAGGALTMATAVIPNWNYISDALQGPIGGITALVSTALLALGAILAFTGVNLPIGIALMASGALGLAATAAVNWNTIVDALQGPIGLITAIVSGALLALGIILLVSGAGIPLGIALLAAGAAGLITTVAVNWNFILDVLKTIFASILAIVSAGLLVLGVLLLLTGAGIGLGLALIFMGLKGSVAAWKLDDNPITRFVKNMANGIVNIINKVIDAINEMFHIKFDGLKIGDVQVIPAFDIRMLNIPKIPLMAEGAFDIPSGQLFVAREAGAEMVGSIGGKTSVANNDQIVAGIAGGVASANEEQNALLREQNSLLRAILEKDSGVYLDGKHLTNSVEKYQRERGRVLITGGVV